MGKKYEILEGETLEYNWKTLHRIRALIDIERHSVKAGDLGGWIEKEKNLSQEGDAWVEDNAKIFDDAKVSGNARVFGQARIGERACISGNARVGWNATVYGEAKVIDDAWIGSDAFIFGNAKISERACVSGYAMVNGDTQVRGDALINGDTQVRGDALINGNAKVSEDALIDDGEYKVITISNLGRRQGTTTFFVCEDGNIKVNCGCFHGTLEAFRAKVRETHGDSKHALAYLAAADFVESVLETGEQST